MSGEHPSGAPRPGGPGSPRPLDPRHSPAQAFAWALVRLREEQMVTQKGLADALSLDKSAVSRMTEGKNLPDEQRVRKYAERCGADQEQWARLRRLASEAMSAPAGDAARKDRETFAQALVERCAADLSGLSTVLGDAQSLASAWAGTGSPSSLPTGAGTSSTPGPAAGAGTDAGTPGAPAAGAGAAAGETARNTDPLGHSRKGQRRTLLLSGALVVLAAAVSIPLSCEGNGEKQPGTASGLDSCRQPAQTLQVVSSTDKSAVLADLAHRYGARSSGGQCVKIEVSSVDSGTAMKALVRGWDTRTDGPRPDVWTPASTVWLAIARQRAAGKDTLALLPQSAGASLASSPLTVAMPRPAAVKLGWPSKKLSWADLANLASKPGFKLGKTNPETSTSGLNATIAAFYTQTGTTGELVPSDLTNKNNQNKVRTIEKAAVHYGETTLTFLANLRRYDDAGQAASYIDAITMEENSVVAYNEGYPCGSRSAEPGCAKKAPPRTKLVAFYPTNDSGVGTIYSDHPYTKLNGLTDAKQGVADDFARFLASQTAQDSFTDLGFRTPSNEPTKKITSDNGARPDAPLPQPLQAPPAGVLDKVLEVWRQLRKPANVLILMDTSGSMGSNAEDRKPITGEPSKLDLVKQARGPLLDGFSEQDRVGLWHFSATHVADADPAPMGARQPDGSTQRARLQAQVARLSPDAATALYSTINKAVQNLRDHYDADAINAVVVLTDGKNETKGGPELEELKRIIGDPDKPPIRVFTIAYGTNAGASELKQIAEATNARAYRASDPNTIPNVLTNVISNF
ncbi:substrate-binding domain-containing protein [Streptomyces sp. NPDC004111]|uniref:substrate-binding domain-containing protein n=1 Tax=Streptomyces sp. NPDC004111 TaxID=3364690 RepID=UPI0036A87060